MYTIKDLVHFSIPDTKVAVDRFSKNPQLILDDYRKTMREIPNLHAFLMRVSNLYGARLMLVNHMWFRIWAAIKAEEEIGLSITLNLLKRLPNIDDRVVTLKYRQRKPLAHCFKALHKLVVQAHENSLNHP